MFGVKFVRENPEAFDQGLARRGLDPHAARILKLDTSKRKIQTEVQEYQQTRNEKSKEIGAAKSRGKDASDLIAEVASLKDVVRTLAQQDQVLSEEINEILSSLPNLPAPDVPDGLDEGSNVELRRWGDRPNFISQPRQHFEIGEALGLMDFDSAAKISGSRFVVLRGALAKLERALAAFMLDLHTQEFGYVEIAPPLLVRESAAFWTGNLPKFADDLFKTTDGYYLIPTAEMPLTSLVSEKILDAKELPIRVTSFTPCFRAEAGAAGRDTRGMIRQHQFSKVELVSITRPEDSEAEHERMTACAEAVLKRLQLPYKVVCLSAGDMGFSARKTYDIEVWLPGQECFREISSCSNCGEFQARRMNARFRQLGEKRTEFAHTLNGSGLAVGRTIVAILENYQNLDGSVTVPEVLRPYLGYLDRLE